MENQNVPISVINKRVLESLNKDNVKLAQDAATDYTRIQIREDSFAFKILPPEQITPEQLNRDLTERNAVIWEIEPDSPGSKWVPLQDVPTGEYITGSRYLIPMARVLTPKYVKDLAELYTYKQDIRKILTDNAIKDALAEIDRKFIQTIDSITDDDAGPGTPNNFTGKVQRLQLSGGINKENLVEALKMLPRGSKTLPGKFRLFNHVMLMNDVTAQDVLKLNAEEVSHAVVEGYWKNGLQSDTILGAKAIFTIKDDLVPDNTIYFFAAPEFLGKCFYIDDWTMYMKKEAYFINMFSYWYGGFGIGNVAGVAKAVFEA